MCYLCDEEINSRDALVKHKEATHKITKLTVCKFFLESRCFNNDDCLYSHKKSNETDNLEHPNNHQTNKSETLKAKRQIVCKKGKKCDRKCEYPENAHMNIRDVRCNFQEKCTKEKCPFKHNTENKSFLEGGHKNHRKA